MIMFHYKRKCCACAHKDLKGGETHICTLTGQETFSFLKCPKFKPRPCLLKEMKGDGRIQKPHYIRWKLERLNEMGLLKYNKSKQLRDEWRRANNERLPQEYEEQFGSRFIEL